MRHTVDGRWVMGNGRSEKGLPFAILYFLFVLLFLSSFAARAQNKDSTLVFKVRNPAMDIQLIPHDSILWIGQKNKIILRWKGERKIASVTLDNGTITESDSSYVLRVKGGKTALLSVYENTGSNTMKLCFTKLFYIEKNPDPVISVCGIMADSVADKLDIIYKDRVMALWEQKNLVLPVLYFRLTTQINGQPDTLISYSEKFTIDMRNRIRQLPEGSVLYFDQVVCRMPDGKEKKLAPIQIFMAKTNKYKVGYREF